MNASHYDHEALERLRESKNRSREEIAQEIGVKRMTLYRAEKGIVASYELLCALARCYGVPVTSFLYPLPKQAA
jgi:transcriptional regulator with XRE-family HTH domain